jgi:hypothetical protein
VLRGRILQENLKDSGQVTQTSKIFQIIGQYLRGNLNAKKLMYMGKVLIIGSGPVALDVNKLEYDRVYCANAAVGNDISKLVARHITAVVTSSLLDPKQTSPEYIHKSNIIKSAYANRWVLVAPNDYIPASEWLLQHKKDQEVIVVANNIRREIIMNSFGVPSVILPFGGGIDRRLVPVIILQYCRAWVNLMRDNSYEPFEFFRVSTGLFCLALAIDENGVDSDYYIAGITARERGWLNENSSSKQPLLSSHLYSDLYSLRKLRSRINVFSFDEKLAALTGVEFYKFNVSF